MAAGSRGTREPFIVVYYIRLTDTLVVLTTLNICFSINIIQDDGSPVLLYTFLCVLVCKVM